MQIVENVLLDELEQIFNLNNKNYVHNKESIFDKSKTKVVCVENGHAIGYLVVYLKNDFIQKKGFDIDYKVEENSAYFWHAITKQGFEGKGVQSAIFEYTLSKYKNYIFYSVVDESNAASLRLHTKCGFNQVANFKRLCDGEYKNYVLLRHTTTRGCNYV